MLDSGISLCKAQANKNSCLTSERTEFRCIAKLSENEGKVFGSMRLRARVMQSSIGMESMEETDISARNGGNLFTRKARKINIVRVDSLRYIPFERTSKAAVISSSTRTIYWP